MRQLFFGGKTKENKGGKIVLCHCFGILMGIANIHYPRQQQTHFLDKSCQIISTFGNSLK